MKVAELIEVLRTMPQDAHVAIQDADTSLYFFDPMVEHEDGFVVLASATAYGQTWVYDLAPLAGIPPSAR